MSLVYPPKTKRATRLLEVAKAERERACRIVRREMANEYSVIVEQIEAAIRSDE